MIKLHFEAKYPNRAFKRLLLNFFANLRSIIETLKQHNRQKIQENPESI